MAAGFLHSDKRRNLKRYEKSSASDRPETCALAETDALDSTLKILRFDNSDKNCPNLPMGKIGVFLSDLNFAS
jgi:hypothetical protein